MEGSRQKEVLILVVCLLIGFALRLYALDSKSLWGDEVYTLNDSRYDLRSQIAFYKVEPTYAHPPLFFILTHMFYPFSKPERDIRIIPLIFGTLSIPMIFLLAKQFCSNIALPCTISLTFMAYHIYLSQDGRFYAFLMFLGMGSLFTFMRFLKTSRFVYVIITAFCFAVLFLTSYTSIPFIVFSQILWLYQGRGNKGKKMLFSFLLLNGLTLLFILPWLCFLGMNYSGQPLTIPYHQEDPGSLSSVLYGLFHDWAASPPLLIVAVILLILSPFFSNKRRKAIILLCMLVFPVGALYLFCKVWNITHFITSRYFINFLPLFLFSLFSTVAALEVKFQKLKKWARPSILLLIFFVVANLFILSYYYHSEKMDFRGLAAYLKANLREGDKVFVVSPALMPGILHYFGNIPIGRQDILYPIAESGGKVGYYSPLFYKHSIYSMYYTKQCCNQYIADGNRLWIIVFKQLAKDFKKSSPAVLKESFNGKVLNLHRFPTDASMYLFLWDPKLPEERGVDLPIE
jgi:hypothetical protein